MTMSSNDRRQGLLEKKTKKRRGFKVVFGNYESLRNKIRQ